MNSIFYKNMAIEIQANPISNPEFPYVYAIFDSCDFHLTDSFDAYATRDEAIEGAKFEINDHIQDQQFKWGAG